MPFATLSRRGRTVCAQAAKNHTGRGRTMFAPTGQIVQTEKYFLRVDHSWSIFYIIRRIDEGRSYASQGECSGTSAGVITTTASALAYEAAPSNRAKPALLGINRAYSHAHRFFSPGKRDFSPGKRHFSSGKSTEQRRAEDRTEEQRRAEHSREQQSRQN